MATAQPGTVEIPMTPAMRQLIAGDAAKVRRILLIVCALIGGLIVVLGAAMGAVGLILMGLAIGAGIYLIGWIYMRFTMSRDVKEANLLRTTGPIEVTQQESQGSATIYRLVLAGHHFTVDKKVAAAAAKVQSGTVDYSKHGHVVFDIRDDAGQTIYRHSGYVPES